MKKIGLFGGTFDPPHYGHLLMANEVKAALSLDEIWFIPNRIPPHKQDEEHSGSHHRMNMLKLAIEGHQEFHTEKIELERQGPSFTYDTMVLLKERHPDKKFYFIIGADMIEYLPNWHMIDELVSILQFVGVKRHGYKTKSPYPIIEVEAPQFEVSSTMLRERFASGYPTDYLLPEKVKTYIEEKHLYGTE
ncbi:nicotinate-nucleotide adenylyltransferase [Metabacillus sp. GX 13764]|uniref:nicotinate-nucleotide adenylyltransferase n=1 Tax=Metabacillus kandeliae TaxID=2900151 RepID=UPI001E4ECC70|nr:nicotinate-nucleotide adenylyltransferase [Metabacillus kandeliae]MCD7033024.1 nicotinate-nucleotide adenylyltransferase [Metabacillus kandeliae]